MTDEFWMVTQTQFVVDATMFVIGFDSVEIGICVSICNCCTFNTFTVPWIAHQILPCTFKSFVTGLVTVPTEIVIGLFVFQPAAMEKS